MKINDQSLRQFLSFWRRIPSEERPEAADAWQQATRATIEALPDDVLDVLIGDSFRAYDEVEAARASSTTRASTLLLVVGILNGLAALTATTLAGAHPVLAAAYLVVAVALGFFAVGTAVLAIRAQQVATWHRPHVMPRDILGARHQRRLRAFEAYAASRLNRHGLREVVGYLRDAQIYALITIGLLATLTVVAAATSATKSSNPPASATPASSPTVPSPSAETPTLSQSPTASSSITSAPTAPRLRRHPLRAQRRHDYRRPDPSEPGCL